MAVDGLLSTTTVQAAGIARIYQLSSPPVKGGGDNRPVSDIELLTLHRGLAAYMEDWMCMHAFGAVCVCVHSPTATATGIARCSQLSSFLLGQAVRYIIAGGPTKVSSPLSSS